MSDLFTGERRTVVLGEGAAVLAGYAGDRVEALLETVTTIAEASPFRHQVTPGGFVMSVAMTNCGRQGWVSDRRGYRYERVDPLTGRDWPAMPELFASLARQAAAELGFDGFAPDACLINRYVAGARLSLHQDRDEASPEAPIVSVSLGAPATFLWGGVARGERVRRIRLGEGDVVVWGGASRMVFHGVAPLHAGERINLTFRRAAA